MEHSDEEYEYLHNEENNSPHKKKNVITRGITVMKRVIRVRDKGVKYEVGPCFVKKSIIYVFVLLDICTY